MTAPVIVALDVATAQEAVRIAGTLAGRVAGFAVGPGLLYGPGPGVVGAVARLGPVLADAKLHDTPGQVEAAARRLAEYGARWVSAHALGGGAMLEAARRGIDSGLRAGDCGLLAVTVLAGFDPAASAATFGRSPGEMVARLARIAAEAGAVGVVSPSRELGVVAAVAPGLLRFTPGVGDGTEAGGAIRRGADLLVIGRPITTADDPARVLEEIASSFEPR